MRELVLRMPAGAVEDVVERLLPLVGGDVREYPTGAHHVELRIRGAAVPTVSQLRGLLGVQVSVQAIMLQAPAS